MSLRAFLLDTRGFAVLRAHSGEEALAFCLEVESIDAILTELRLKDMDGVELARRTRAVRPDAPVAITSAAPVSMAQVAESPHIRFCLPHDARPADVIACVHRMTARKRGPKTARKPVASVAVAFVAQEVA